MTVIKTITVLVLLGIGVTAVIHIQNSGGIGAAGAEAAEPFPFQDLSRYNSEVARGLVHTEEWKAYMAIRQQEFNEWVQCEYHKQYRDHDHCPEG